MTSNQQRPGINRRTTVNASEFRADVMLLGTNEDLEIYQLALNTLKEQGVNVWPPAEKCDLAFNTANAARAVNGCTCFIPLLSKTSIEIESFRDCLSLAYITNKSIVPLGVQRCGELRKTMNAGMRLIVLPINWHFVNDPQTRYQALLNLSKMLKEDHMPSVEKDQTASEGVVGLVNTVEISTHGGFPASQIQERLITGVTEPIEDQQNSVPAPSKGHQLDFWVRNFGEKDTVSWKEFENAFLEDYKTMIQEDFENRQNWLLHDVVKKDINLNEDTVNRSHIEAFHDGKDLYRRVHGYTTGKMAMKSVFGMRSTIRLDVIKNMGQFSTDYVIKRLLKMLVDEDPDIRAIAALALGQSVLQTRPEMHAQAVKALGDLLDNRSLSRDRLVRESTVLALGKLQSNRHVKKLAHLWRNDAIRDVREAAEVALEKIGGPDVEDAMRVTHTLNKEVDYLRVNSKKIS